MKNKSGPEILAAYQRAHALFTQRGLRPLSRYSTMRHVS
jgi:hypothetical protein